MDRAALTARIDRLEIVLLSALNTTTQQLSQTTANGASVSTKEENSKMRGPIAHDGHENGQGGVDMEQLEKELGVLRVQPTQTLYHGGQHWVSTMFQIQEFRDYLEANSDDLSRVALENKKTLGRDESALSLLRGTNAPLGKKELLLHVPSRVMMDMLVARYFDYVNLSIPVIHESTFRHEYIEHWKDPGQTEVTWLGLLFAILHHAALSFDEDGEGHFHSYAADYRRRTVQCLIAANYTDPQMYTVEVLVLHIYAEWMTSIDSSVEVSLLLGMVIRLAMRVGMHRDSRAYDSVTPFHGEMRRRVWATIRTMDIICSFQLSLPGTIHFGDSRCAIPRNIFNDELNKTMKQLPTPRELSEATEISFTIIKTRLVLELGKILAFVESEDDPNIDDISKYEQSLEEVKRMIPRWLRVSSIQESTVVSPQIHRQRIGLDRLYQVSKCVLHRRSLSRARRDTSRLQHRGSCIDAAMTLLGHQANLYSDLSADYPQQIRKRHMYALTTHDFYTASMAVALDLHYGFEAEPSTPCPSDIAFWGHDRRNEMINALEKSTEVCGISKDESIEAANAYGMLCFVVAKARKTQLMISEQQVKDNPSVPGQVSKLDPTAHVFEFGAEIFNDPLPDFDWNFWNQFDSNYGEF